MTPPVRRGRRNDNVGSSRLSPHSLAVARLSLRGVILLGTLLGITIAFAGVTSPQPRSAPEGAVSQPAVTPESMGVRKQAGRFVVAGAIWTVPYVEPSGIRADDERSMSTAGFPQTPQVVQRVPLGSLVATGDVYLNDRPISGETTLLVDDVIRTRADGNAVLTLPGRGQLSVSPDTLISFKPGAQYFASLESGKVVFRSLAGARKIQVRVGILTVVPSSEVDSTIEIERLPDASGRVRCVAGSVGLIALEGPLAVFIGANESVAYTAQGEVTKITEAAPEKTGPEAPPTPPPSPPSTRSPQAKRTGGSAKWVILAVAGGGAAGAAAALGHGGGRSAVSPSIP